MNPLLRLLYALVNDHDLTGFDITVRCDNREFRLSDRTCREVLLDAIKRGLEKYGFKLYARLAL